MRWASSRSRASRAAAGLLVWRSWAAAWRRVSSSGSVCCHQSGKRQRWRPEGCGSSVVGWRWRATDPQQLPVVFRDGCGPWSPGGVSTTKLQGGGQCACVAADLSIAPAIPHQVQRFGLAVAELLPVSSFCSCCLRSIAAQWESRGSPPMFAGSSFSSIEHPRRFREQPQIPCAAIVEEKEELIFFFMGERCRYCGTLQRRSPMAKRSSSMVPSSARALRLLRACTAGWLLDAYSWGSAAQTCEVVSHSPAAAASTS